MNNQNNLWSLIFFDLHNQFLNMQQILLNYKYSDTALRRQEHLQKIPGINIKFYYICYQRNIIFKHWQFRKLIPNCNTCFYFEACNFRTFVSNCHIDKYIQLPCLTAYFNLKACVIFLFCTFTNRKINIKITVLLQKPFSWYCIFKYNHLWLFSSGTTLVNA